MQGGAVPAGLRSPGACGTNLGGGTHVPPASCTAGSRPAGPPPTAGQRAPQVARPLKPASCTTTVITWATWPPRVGKMPGRLTDSGACYRHRKLVINMGTTCQNIFERFLRRSSVCCYKSFAALYPKCKIFGRELVPAKHKPYVSTFWCLARTAHRMRCA